MSSPVLPMTVTSVTVVSSVLPGRASSSSATRSPRRNRAPPMPPASATTRRQLWKLLDEDSGESLPSSMSPDSGMGRKAHDARVDVPSDALI